MWQSIDNFNPFAPEPPVPIHVLSTACDVISFNGRGQLCPLTCAEWRDLSNHTRMKPITYPAREKKWGKKSEKRREERKRKVKVKTAQFCFLRMPELRKLIFCIWIRRPPSVRPVAPQWPENCLTSFKTRFSAKSPGANGLMQFFYAFLSYTLVAFVVLALRFTITV